MPNSGRKLSLEKGYYTGGIIIAVITILGLGIGIGYKISDSKNDSLTEQLRFQKEINSYKLPELLDSLKNVNSSLKRLSNEIIVYTELKSAYDSLAQVKSELEQNNKSFIAELSTSKAKEQSLTESILRLNTEITKFNASKKSYNLSEGQSIDLVNNIITIGIINVYGTSVDFNLNNNRKSLNIGEYLWIDIGDKKGKITLSSIDYNGSVENIVNYVKNKCSIDFIIIDK